MTHEVLNQVPPLVGHSTADDPALLEGLRREGAGWAEDEVREVERRDAAGLFLLLGAEPHCEWVPDVITRSDDGYVLTGRNTSRDTWVDGMPPPGLATNVPGVFAVGDIRDGSMKRVASASGEGASVVPLVHAWLAEDPSLE